MATHATTTTSPRPAAADSRPGESGPDRADVIAFPSGLPGFETCRSFVLLASNELAPLSLLQSVDGPMASFLVIDPRLVLSDYRCALSQADLTRLGASETSVLLWLAIVSVADDGQAWANMRAPIVVNPGRMIGYQVLPHNSLYPLRHPLAQV